MTRSYARVAVIIPCHNEEVTVAAVVEGFHAALPGATVHVCDNASTDRTAECARAAGARVITEPRPGKGNAVRRLFADVDADVYVMADGDATYDPSASPAMVALVLDEGLDMVNGARDAGSGAPEAYRRGHQLGNALLTNVFQRLFKVRIDDTLSGYRCFSRRFVKSFPSMASGFEIEAEINAHVAAVGANYDEVSTVYGSRPTGSESKLSTYRDGWRILRRNLALFTEWQPMAAYSVLAGPFALLGLWLFFRAISDYVDTGLVPKFPSLIAAVGVSVVAAMLLVCGVVLSGTKRNRIEAVRLAYLATASPARDG